MIDIANETQQRLDASVMAAPCFINGDGKLVAGADKTGKVEVFDVRSRELVKMFQSGSSYIGSMHSANNILGTGGDDRTIRLWDVRNWEMFHSSTYKLQPTSIHLTADFKYLTIGGWEGEICVVLQIK